MKKSIRYSFSRFASLTLLLGLFPASTLLASGLQDHLKTCSYCHGKDGASTDPEIPIIGGYSTEFLIDNLTYYRDHDRDCPEAKFRSGPDKDKKTTMCKIVEHFTDADIKQIADYLSKKKFVRAKQKFDSALAAKGKDVHDMYCEKCHSDGATQAKDDAGMMAGQWIPYLTQALNEFQQGKRPIPKKMKAKLKDVTPDDIKALIQFYGSYH